MRKVWLPAASWVIFIGFSSTNSLATDAATQASAEKLEHEAKLNTIDIKDKQLAHAKVLLAGKLLYGEEMPKDPERGLLLLQEALVLDPECTEAMLSLAREYQMGLHVAKNDDKRLGYLKKAATLDDAWAMVMLADYMNEKGARDEGFQWYFKAAQKGSPSGMLMLGWCYHNGDGVKKDDVKARKWFSDAAKNNRYEGVVVLFEAMKNGIGGEVDKEGAYKLVIDAANHKSWDALALVGVCLRDGIGAKQDKKLAKEKLMTAFDHGSAIAAYNLGMWYESADGPQDYKKALNYFTTAWKWGLGESADLKIRETLGNLSKSP